nr:hypothetical protein [Idiomarina zobellii]
MNLISAAFKQGIHKSIDKAVVQLSEVRLSQRRQHQWKARTVVCHQDAVSALQRNEVTVPSA